MSSDNAPVPPASPQPRKLGIAVIVGVAGLALAGGLAVALLSRSGLPPASSEQRGAGTQPRATPAAVSAPAQPVTSGDSAVARGGSRSKVTPTTRNGEVLLPGESKATASPTVLGASGEGPLRIEVLEAVYDVSGKPQDGCASFDVSTPVRRLTLSLVLENSSETDIANNEWGAAAFAGDQRATLCLVDAAGGLPTLAKGVRQPVRFAAFVSANASVSAIAVNTVQGLAAKVCFDEAKVVPCQ